MQIFYKHRTTVGHLFWSIASECTFIKLHNFCLCCLNWRLFVMYKSSIEGPPVFFSCFSLKCFNKNCFALVSVFHPLYNCTKYCSHRLHREKWLHSNTSSSTGGAEQIYDACFVSSRSNKSHIFSPDPMRLLLLMITYWTQTIIRKYYWPKYWEFLSIEFLDKKS